MVGPSGFSPAILAYRSEESGDSGAMKSIRGELVDLHSNPVFLFVPLPLASVGLAKIFCMQCFILLYFFFYFKIKKPFAHHTIVIKLI